MTTRKKDQNHARRWLPLPAEPVACDIRDKDLDGPVGFDSDAQRKREFAADMGIQAHARRCAAEGLVTADKEVVGEAWKPFQRQAENPGQTVDLEATELQMAALG